MQADLSHVLLLCAPSSDIYFTLRSIISTHFPHLPTYPFDLELPIPICETDYSKVPRTISPIDNHYSTTQVSPLVRISCTRGCDTDHYGVVTEFSSFAAPEAYRATRFHNQFLDVHGRARAFVRLMTGKAGSDFEHGVADYFKHAVPHWNINQQTRHTVTMDVALSWLAGRDDLRPIAHTLARASFFGASSFITTVAMTCMIPGFPSVLAHVGPGLFSCCHECGLAYAKKLALWFRLHTEETYCGVPCCSLQYIAHVFGRYDHPLFRDNADVETRLDYNDLIAPNFLTPLVPELRKEFELEISAMGESFAYAALSNANYIREGVLPLCRRAMTAVPAGSSPQAMVPGVMGSLPPTAVNKKTAYSIMTTGENAALLEAGKLNSVSLVLDKTEVSKMRNLCPGSVALYDASATLSALAEDQFLASLPECPLMWSEPKKIAHMRDLQACSASAYATARDYANFNIRHDHDEIRLFYLSMRKTFVRRSAHDLVTVVDTILSCLDTIGVMHDGQYYAWNYGLMSGWRHTMLINTSFNIALGRAAGRVIKQHYSMGVLKRAHMGDDSVEVNNHAFCGPLMQTLLDAFGSVGKPEKQHFASRVGSWFEFTRENYLPTGHVVAASVRAVSGFVSSDLQHNPLRAGTELVDGIAESLNTITRRCGGVIALRESDIKRLMQRWATPTFLHKLGYVAPWYSPFLAIGSGGGGIAPAYPLRHPAAQLARVRVPCASPLEVEPMRHRLASKLQQNSPLDLRDYVNEYADEVFACHYVCVTVCVGAEVSDLWREHVRACATRSDATNGLVAESTLVVRTKQSLTDAESNAGVKRWHRALARRRGRGSPGGGSVGTLAAAGVPGRLCQFPPLARNRRNTVFGVARDMDLGAASAAAVAAVADSAGLIACGARVPLSNRELPTQIAVARYFAGSSKVARAYMRDHPTFSPVVEATHYGRMTLVGLRQLSEAGEEELETPLFGGYKSLTNKAEHVLYFQHTFSTVVQQRTTSVSALATLAVRCVPLLGLYI